jgi:hypothetical protein
MFSAPYIRRASRASPERLVFALTLNFVVVLDGVGRMTIWHVKTGICHIAKD